MFPLGGIVILWNKEIGTEDDSFMLTLNYLEREELKNLLIN